MPVASMYVASSASIADGAVSEAKLAAQACSAAKMKKEGTANYVLTSNGAGAVPSYQALPAVSMASYMAVLFGKQGISPTSADLVSGTEVSGASSYLYDKDTNLGWRLDDDSNVVVFRVHFSAVSASGVIIYWDNQDSVALTNIKVETSPDNTNWTSKYDQAVAMGGTTIPIAITWAAVASTTDLKITLTTGNTNGTRLREVIVLV